MSKKPELKVTTSSFAAAVAGLVLWLLGNYVFKGTVPELVVLLVNILVPGILAFVTGYITHHTHRPDLSSEASE